MVVNDLVTTIRKLVLDEGSNVFSSTQIRRLIGMVQQDFCIRSKCHVKVIRLAAPPQLQYAFTFSWEEGMLGEERIFRFSFIDSFRSVTQPWESEEGFAQSTTGGNTLTCGADLEQVDPQKQMPYPLGNAVHEVLELVWDYNVVEQKSKRWLENSFRDAFNKRGDVVDYFAFDDELRRDSLLLYGMPYTYSNITSLSEALPFYQYKSSGSCPSGYSSSGDICVKAGTVAALAADLGYAFVIGIPDRPNALSTVFEINGPFVKYVGFGVAERLLSADTELKNSSKAEHYKVRYEAGIAIVRSVVRKGLSYKKFRMSEGRGSRLRSSLSPPRLPDHYPRNPACR